MNTYGFDTQSRLPDLLIRLWRTTRYPDFPSTVLGTGLIPALRISILSPVFCILCTINDFVKYYTKLYA